MIFSEFLDNESTKRYYEIIENARLFPIPVDTYTEKYHIIPKSFYKSKDKSGWLVGTPNSPDNFVILTGREHFICHKLLTEMLPEESKAKMSKAALERKPHSIETKAKMSKS